MYSYRKANLEDATFIAEFNRAMAKETESIELSMSKLERGVQAVIADPGKGFYLIAASKSTNQPIACLMITYEWSDWRNGNFWWIQSVYVLPEHRGEKVFSNLYKNVEVLSRSVENCVGIRLYVETHNLHAKKVYEKLGMKKLSYQMYSSTS